MPKAKPLNIKVTYREMTPDEEKGFATAIDLLISELVRQELNKQSRPEVQPNDRANEPLPFSQG